MALYYLGLSICWQRLHICNTMGTGIYEYKIGTMLENLNYFTILFPQR